MSDEPRKSTDVWYTASARNMLIFALLWLGEAFLILLFVKWAFHVSAALYLFMIPWAGLGLVMIVRPSWILRLNQAVMNKIDRDLERFGKWWPPGLP